ncbi:MAG: c-type cytochrome [Gammaproteobacteria bacterium]
MLASVGILITPGSIFAAGSAERGAQQAITCAACHGADGNSANPAWPSLAGQHESYLASTLQAFNKGSRSDVLMSAQAQTLSEESIADLAAYFAAQKPVGRTADPALLEVGEKIYRGGNIEKKISACIACHGPSGRGNLPAAYPSLAGQHAAYTAKQLRDYASGTRTSDKAQIMRSIAALLSDDEIAAVSSYIQGLR